MAAWGYVEYKGKWVKMEDVGKRARNAGQQRQQPHPAQLEDELGYQEEYRHVEVDNAIPETLKATSRMTSF